MLRLALLFSLCCLFLIPCHVQAETAFQKIGTESSFAPKTSLSEKSNYATVSTHILCVNSGILVDDSLFQAKVYRRSKFSKWLGISSLISLFTPLGILALPAAIVAVVMGKHVKIDATDNASRKNAATGITTGWITIGLIALAVLVTILVLAIFFSTWR